MSRREATKKRARSCERTGKFILIHVEELDRENLLNDSLQEQKVELTKLKYVIKKIKSPLSK